MNLKGIGLLLLFLLTGLVPRAQNSDQVKLREAKVFFSHQRYAQALAVISSSRQLSRFDQEGRFLKAICQYQINKLDDAYQTLNGLTQETDPPYPECWLYLAKIFHAQHRFKEASDYYKTYLRSIFPNDPNRRMIIEEIRRCANGIDLQYQQVKVVTENLGAGVNTEGDEFAPVASPNHADRLYFSAIRVQNTGGPRNAYGNADPQWGEYFSDLFVSQVNAGHWGNATPMHYLLNSPKHEVLLGFSADGLALYYFKGWNLNRGEIVVDTFRNVEDRLLSSTPLAGPVHPEQGDNYPVFYRDTLVIFASNRPGGYGGWDLYKASKKNGRWLLPENLGPTVNTAFDETTPFLANDGQTLYFSSNDSRKSIGGLDIFRTHFIPAKNQWLPPQNVGLPINSSADDAFFKVSRDGFTAYFSSSRKDGYGKRDIYVALFQDFLPEMEYPSGFYSSNPAPPRPAPIIVQTQDQPAANDQVENDFPENNYQPVSIPANTGVVKPAPEVRPDPTQPVPKPVTTPPDAAPVVLNAGNTGGYAPVLLEGNQIVANQFNMLDRLSEELVRLPDLRLMITAGQEKSEPTGSALFAAIEKAEAVALYFLGKGVSEDQVFMRGVINSGSPERNKQVELTFSTKSGQPPPNHLPSLDSRHSAVDVQSLINQPLHYKIQVASAKGPIRESFLEGFPEPMIEKTPDFDYYRYTLGAFSDRSEAGRFIQKMKANGRTSAFLAIYRQGWRSQR